MASHLSVVLDLPPSLALPAVLAQLLAFLNAHVALRHENTLAVFAALPGTSVMLFPSAAPPPATVDANSYPPFRRLDAAVVATLAALLDDAPSDAPTALVGALTKALCYINRISQGDVVADPRILVLSASPDLSTSYIPIMNAIFSAQKLKITIDACQIAGPETVFLQQAAHLTGGAYLYLDRTDALLQHLIVRLSATVSARLILPQMAFLPPPAIRSVLAVPTQDRIDFRAACFCHKNIIDVGFVCSVCLSIFCQPVPVCSTCRTKFPIKTLKRLNASRPPTAAAPARPPPATPTLTPTRPPPPSADPAKNGFSAHNIHVINGSKH